MSRLSTFTGYFVHTLGSSALGTLASVAIVIVTAQALGPAGRGAMSLLLLVPTLAVTAGRMGVGHAVNYYANRWQKDELIGSALALAMLAGAAVTAVTMPIVVLLKDVFFQGIPSSLLILACCAIPFGFLADYLPSLFQGYYDIKRRNLLVLGGPVLQLVLLCVFVLWLGLDTTGALLAFVISSVLTGVASVVLVFRVFRIEHLKPERSRMAALVRYGLQSHLGLVFKELNYRGDVFVVSYFLGPAAVGLYAAAVNVAEMLWKLPDAVGIVLLPRVAQLPRAEAASFAATVFRALIPPMFLACVATAIVGRWIVAILFGPEFEGSLQPLLWLVPGMFALAFWKILANALVGLGRPMKYSITSVVGCVVMLTFDLLLIPVMGIAGAALASSISYVVSTVHISWLFSRETGLPMSVLWTPRRQDFGVYRRVLADVLRRPRPDDNPAVTQPSTSGIR